LELNKIIKNEIIMGFFNDLLEINVLKIKPSYYNDYSKIEKYLNIEIWLIQNVFSTEF